jgi:hypothetical protein
MSAVPGRPRDTGHALLDAPVRDLGWVAVVAVVVSGAVTGGFVGLIWWLL